MTIMLDAPTTARKEKVMLKRKMAATAEPETTTVTELPVGEQASTIVVTDGSDLEQPVEVVADTSLEAVTEPDTTEAEIIAEPSTLEDDDEFPMAQPRTLSLPMLGFKPVRKDMSDDEVPYAAPMSMSPFFADDDDEPTTGKPVGASGLLSEDLVAALEASLAQEHEQAKFREKAEEEARKAKAEHDEAKRLARIENRGSRRMLGNIMMAAGTFAVIYGAVVTFVPGM